MNALLLPFVVPFRLIGRFPVPTIIVSAILAVVCYFLDQGSGLAFFACMSSGILIWYDEVSYGRRHPAAVPAAA